MNDRELLELAAKAAGIDWCAYSPDRTDNCSLCLQPSGRIWNPLTDDGDALRLAVKLSLGIEINQCSVIACWVDAGCETKDVYEYPESVQDDNFDIVYVNHDKATRRAIVRAAAEIGRSLK